MNDIVKKYKGYYMVIMCDEPHSYWVFGRLVREGRWLEWRGRV